MAENKQKEQTKQNLGTGSGEDPKVQVKEKTDFVKLVKEAVPAMGQSSFTRVNLKQHVTDQGLEDLNEVFAKEGFEVFSNGKSVLLLKQ